MEMYESYLNQIQRYALLSAEEEESLSRRVEQGDRKALSRLVQANLRLVVSVAKRFASDKTSIMDLIQEGNIALMSAATKYHYAFKTRFSTYAYSWVLQYMLRYLYHRTSLIALPQRKNEVLRNVEKTRALLRQRRGVEPTVAELAHELDVDEVELKNMLSYTYSYSSLDTPCSENGDASVGDFVADETYNPEYLFFRQQEKKDVSDLLRTLPEKERTVIVSRFNFAHDVQIKTLRELSIELDVSAETIRQMELRAVRRMKKLLLARRTDASAAETA